LTAEQRSNSKKIDCTCTGVPTYTTHLNHPTHRQHITPVSLPSRCRSSR